MTWIEAARVLGRRPVTIVEIDLDYCQLEYGVGACPAVLGVDSLVKCYNTKKTCAVPAAYDPVAKTYRFSNRELGPGIPHIPCLNAVTFVSTKIDPGRSLGVRSSVSFTLQDLTWDDRDLDKYLSTRTYDPETQGSYLGRMIARNPYYQNRPARVLNGYIEEDGSIDLSSFQTQTFILERFQGPDAKGIVKVDCMDIIRMIDDEKAQIPPTSTGMLQSSIDADDTTITLVPAGVGDEEYPAFGVAAIDTEIVNFSRIGDVVTLNLRGAQSTVAEEHDAEATFQICKVYDDVLLTDALYEMFTDPLYGNTPAAFIDKVAWDAEAANWLSGHRLNCTIAIPVGVNALIGELISTCLFYIWWDEVAALIQFKAVRPEDPSIQARVLTDDDSFLEDSLSITEDPDQRVSQVWTPYDRKNPLLKLDEYRNYRTVPVYLDTRAESAIEYGEKRVRRIPCRFFSDANAAQVAVLGARIMARYRDNPRTFKFELDAKDADILVGDVVEVHTRQLQGVDGAPITTNMVILRRTPKREGDKFAYEATDTFFYGRYMFIMENGTPDYLAATQEDRDKGLFICQDDGFMPNGDPGYKII